MARMITLRLSDSAYEAVKRYADADQQSMNSWIENLLDIEDMRRRCAAHDHGFERTPMPQRLARRGPIAILTS